MLRDAFKVDETVGEVQLAYLPEPRRGQAVWNLLGGKFAYFEWIVWSMDYNQDVVI